MRAKDVKAAARGVHAPGRTVWVLRLLVLLCAGEKSMSLHGEEMTQLVPKAGWNCTAEGGEVCGERKEAKQLQGSSWGRVHIAGREITGGGEPSSGKRGCWAEPGTTGEQQKVARADKSGEPFLLAALGGCLKSLPADETVGSGYQPLQGQPRGVCRHASAAADQKEAWLLVCYLVFSLVLNKQTGNHPGRRRV